MSARMASPNPWHDEPRSSRARPRRSSSASDRRRPRSSTSTTSSSVAARCASHSTPRRAHPPASISTARPRHPTGVARARSRRPRARSLHPRGHQPGRRAHAADARPLPARVGKTLTVRLADVDNEHRRVEGVLVSADDRSATLRIDDPDGVGHVDREIAYTEIDRARTVFEWGPAPKPGSPRRSPPGRSPPSRAQEPQRPTSPSTTAGSPQHGRDAGARTSKEKHSS
jgi:hypothetical protein